MGDVEDAGGSRGLCGTVCGGAARAGFALGEVEDTGTPTVGVHGQKRATAGLLHVVAVGGNGENIDRLHDGYASREARDP